MQTVTVSPKYQVVIPKVVREALPLRPGQKMQVVDLTASLAIAASKLSLEHNLPMADSIVPATAREFDVTVWTQDSDFKNVGAVKYFPKK